VLQDGEVVVAVGALRARVSKRHVWTGFWAGLVAFSVALSPGSPAFAGPVVSRHGPAGPSAVSVPVGTGSSRAPVKSQTDGVGVTRLDHATLPTAGAATLATAGKPATVGGMPLTMSSVNLSAAALKALGTAGHGEAGPTSVGVGVLDQASARKLGIAGVVFTLSRADGVAGTGHVKLRLDYSGFANAFGANFGARLHLVQLPACALTTPLVAACQRQTDVPDTNAGSALTADVALPGASAATGSAKGVTSDGLVSSPRVVMAATSSNSSADGTFSATSLTPAFGWSAGNQGGSFAFSYPLRVPPAIGGPAPQLSLAYDSGNVDAQTLAENGQTSWVGEGWNLQTGFIERSYRSCSDDGGSTPDLCWFTGDNATMVFQGRSVRLVHDATTGVWHSSDDSALMINHLTDTSRGNGDNDGEYWEVKTQDGTRYYFGINKRYSGDTASTNSTQLVPVFGNNSGEPCYNATFANAHCVQAYRWNLDYVIDPHGNSMTYFYAKSTGHIGLDSNTINATYDYDDTLDHIDYGTRAGSEATQTVPMQVFFTKSGRCVNTCQPNTSDYPDTPWDLFCSSSSSCPNTTSPAFWTQYKLSTVYTQVWDPASSSYHKVDQWDMSYTYPTSGDNISPAGADTSPNLWLQTVTHTGYASNGTTTLAEPAVTFGGTAMFNRVDWGDDIGVAPFTHYRLTSILNGIGGQTLVTYSGTECARGWVPIVEDNPYRCFPEYFKPTLAPAGWGWFNKYIVTGVTDKDLTGGSPDEVWSYAYSTANSSDPSLWRHDYNETSILAQRSWSVWQGYSTVTTTHGTAGGPQTVTTNVYYRGMDGDGRASADNSAMVWNTRRVGVTMPVTFAGAQPWSGAVGRCLDIVGGGTADGTNIDLSTCNGGVGQVFRVSWDTSGRPILTNPNSAKCVAVAGGGTANGTNVALATCNNATSQVWERQPDGSYLNTNSGRCLESTGGSTANGANVDIWDCPSTRQVNFLWQPRNDGSLIQPQQQRCIDITGAVYNDGTKIEDWVCNNQANQVWRLQTNGTVVNPASGKCLDITNSGTANGTPIQLATCTAAANQLWWVKSDGTLENSASGRCLDATSNPTNGAQLVINDCVWMSPSQVWAEYFVDTEGAEGFVADAQQLDASLTPGLSTSTIHIPTITQTAARNAAITPGSGSSAGGQVFAAHMLTDTDDMTRTYRAVSNDWQWTETQTTYNSYGLPTVVKNLGNINTTTDDTCTTTTYASPDTTKWFINFPAQTVTTDCAASPGDADYLAGAQIFYDSSTTDGAMPTEGDLTRINSLASVSAGALTWTQQSRYGFDGNGRVIATRDALDNRTGIAFTPASGAPVTQVVTTNPVGWTTTNTIDPGKSSITSSVDANSKTTSARYDPLGRLTDVWLHNRATTGTPDRHYVYTLSASAPSTVETDALGPNGVATASFVLYDGQLRSRQTQAPDGVAGGGRLVTDAAYDSRGLTAKASTFYNSSAPAGSLVTFGDTDVADQHRYTYDNLGRATVDALYKNNVLQFQSGTAYDGNRITVTPPSGGSATRTIFDALGRTTELDQFLGSSPTGALQATHYFYDRLGHQTSMTDPAGNTWSKVYDLRGRVTSQADPDTGSSTMSYDDNGRLLSTVDARNITLSYVRDVLERATAVWQGAPSTGTKLTDFTYDTLAKGQLTSANRYSSGGTYTTAATGYDDAYRPLGTTVTIPASEGFGQTSWTTASTYNVDGSVATAGLPAAGSLAVETLTYTYADAGFLRTISGQASYVANAGYDTMNRLTELDLGADQGIHLGRAFDPATGRLSQTVAGTGGTSGNWSTWSDQLAVGYTYDPAGNVTSRSYTEADASTSNECFQYDGLRELTQAWTTTAACQSTPTQSIVGGPDPYWQTYTYDTVGDRTSQVVHAAPGDATYTYAYPTTHTQPHTLTSVTATGAVTGTSSYAYDPAGNTTTRNVMAQPGQTLTWDAEGHLATLTANGQTTTYIYDAAGNRLLAKDANGSTLYLGASDVHKNTSGAVTGTRYYGAGGYQFATRADSGTLTYLSQDNHGTTDIALNATTKAVTARLRTDPFGNPRDANVWPSTHGFVGGNTDPTGLTHLGARDYDPGVGRFVSADPLLNTLNPQQWNGYSYASDAPLTLEDPTGRMAECSECGGAGLTPDQLLQVTTPPDIDNYDHNANIFKHKGHAKYWAGILFQQTISTIKQYEKENGKTLSASKIGIQIQAGVVGGRPYVMVTVNEGSRFPQVLLDRLRGMGVIVIQEAREGDPSTAYEHTETTGNKAKRQLALFRGKNGKPADISTDAVVNNIPMCSQPCADASTDTLNDPNIQFKPNSKPGAFDGDVGAVNGQKLTDRNDPLGEAYDISIHETMNLAITDQVPDAVPSQVQWDELEGGPDGSMGGDDIVDI
jgi:RHS repeat-associated protein